MKLFLLFILLSGVSADKADHMGVVKDVKRINRRLRTIEDTIAEERIQRREDVQSVLDKLSELQTAISVNHRNNQENNNENTLDSKRSTQLVKQMVHAITQEKKVNLRFRREVQDQLAEQSNVCVAVSDFRSEFKIKMDFIEDHCNGNNDISTKLTKYTEMSNKFVMKTDLSYVKEVITKDILGILTSMSDFRSEFKSKTDFLEDRCMNDISTKLTRYTDMSRNLVTKTDLSSAEEVITRELQIINKKVTEFSSCLELYHAGFTTDGIYKIRIKGRYVDVYCDQTTDGGGWVVFQRRQDGSEDFYRAWSEYKHGFGDLDGEFWLGNDNLADLTETCCHVLRVELGDVDGNSKYAKYSQFRVQNEGSLYELNINGYSGNAGDSLSDHNSTKFSTKDADHDTNDDYHCADGWKGAWWFNSCYRAHLNGVYHSSGYIESGKGRISWIDWKHNLGNGTYHSLTFSEMKFRSNHGHA